MKLMYKTALLRFPCRNLLWGQVMPSGTNEHTLGQFSSRTSMPSSLPCGEQIGMYSAALPSLGPSGPVIGKDSRRSTQTRQMFQSQKWLYTTSLCNFADFSSPLQAEVLSVELRTIAFVCCRTPRSTWAMGVWAPRAAWILLSLVSPMEGGDSLKMNVFLISSFCII